MSHNFTSLFIPMEDLFDTPLSEQEIQFHQHSVMLAMALLRMAHPVTNIVNALRLLEFKHSSGRFFKHDEVKQIVKDMLAGKLAD